MASTRCATKFHEALLRHHDSPARPPQRPEWDPDRHFLDWHGREVFKGEPRHRHP